MATPRMFPTPAELAEASLNSDVDDAFAIAHKETDKLADALAEFLTNYPYLLSGRERDAIAGVVTMIEGMGARETKTLDAAIKICIERARERATGGVK